MQHVAGENPRAQTTALERFPFKLDHIRTS